jgi:RNA polymerase sigma-70 factor (ECF subfamily)
MDSMGSLVADIPERVATDATSFDDQFGEARDRLVRICAGLVGVDSADDVVQDTYLRARSRHGQLRDHALFQAWLTRIAINLCMNQHRAQGRWTDRLTKLWQQPRAELHGRDVGLRELIEALPPRQRTAIVLHYGHGYTLEEVARMTGLTPGNVRTIVFRARKHLRQQLEEAHR